MKNKSLTFIFLLYGLVSLALPLKGNVRDTISLAGEWNYRLLSAPTSIPGEGTVSLPSTLDLSHKTVYNPPSDNTTELRREFSYAGEATYYNNVLIPENWRGRDIFLTMERTRPSTVKIDGNVIGSNSRVSSAQHYDLTEYLTPGSHMIEIAVNNADSVPPGVRRNSHEFSESTQTNWNGILGEFLLESRDPFHISEYKYQTDLSRREVDVTVDFSMPAPRNLVLNITLTAENGERFFSKTIDIKKGSSQVAFIMPITEKMKLWSHRHPYLYELKLAVSDMSGKVSDEISSLIGLREFSAAGNSFSINGNPVFLRGTVNAAVFPLTAHVPTDAEYWKQYFSTLKEYGINHVRFHSWTPPEVCFAAADAAGIYIQTELPIWGELDRDLKFHERFLREDLEGLVESYSKHPSFVLFSVGNELWGDISLMGEFMSAAKDENPHLLTTYGSNVYLGMKGEIGEEDFIVASKIGDDFENAVRGSFSFADSPTGGFFNSAQPNSNTDFSRGLSGISVPVIAHEVGQYQSYPLFRESEKFTGLLKADNLAEFRQRALEAGTLRKNEDFTAASGIWAGKLYKAEMEMSQRTPGIGGFQLFGLQDYPGQGTSLVGVLDPFMDSKGFISPEEWRRSCSDLMIMAEFPKFGFYSGERVEIPVITLNYTENPDSISRIKWTYGESDGEFLVISGNGIISQERLELKLPDVSSPRKMTLELSADDGVTANSYDFYVYPSELPKVDNVTVTNNLTEALIILDQGGRVILCPDSLTIADASLPPLFTTDFWNYRMFRTICDEMGLEPSPGTLGLLINETHPALKDFPTEFYTDVQWWPIISNSRPLIIDRLPKDYDPIVEVIDNVERNFRLALMLECNVGKGKLIILSADLEKIGAYPEGAWLLESVKEYISSKGFRPQLTLTSDQVVNLLTKPSRQRLIKELKNETYKKYVE